MEHLKNDNLSLLEAVFFSFILLIRRTSSLLLLNLSEKNVQKIFLVKLPSSQNDLTQFSYRASYQIHTRMRRHLKHVC